MYLLHFNMCHEQKKNFNFRDRFLTFYSNLPSTRTFKVSGIILFQ